MNLLRSLALAGEILSNETLEKQKEFRFQSIDSFNF